MTPEELVGKKVRLTKTFSYNLNTFRSGTLMRVIELYGQGEGIVLRDRMRPDIRLVLGPSELQYCHIIHDDGHCFSCNQDVVSSDGRTCPLCRKIMWELVARQAKDPR